MVAAALRGADGLWLMQRRSFQSAHGGLWEFPGGKVEPGETPQTALARELAEELGIEVAPAALSPVGFAADGPEAEAPIVMLLYEADSWSGVPHCRQGEEIAWLPLSSIGQLDMPPLDYPLWRALERTYTLAKPD